MCNRCHTDASARSWLAITTPGLSYRARSAAVSRAWRPIESSTPYVDTRRKTRASLRGKYATNCSPMSSATSTTCRRSAVSVAFCATRSRALPTTTWCQPALVAALGVVPRPSCCSAADSTARSTRTPCTPPGRRVPLTATAQFPAVSTRRRPVGPPRRLCAAWARCRRIQSAPLPPPPLQLSPLLGPSRRDRPLTRRSPRPLQQRPPLFGPPPPPVPAGLRLTPSLIYSASDPYRAHVRSTPLRPTTRRCPVAAASPGRRRPYRAWRPTRAALRRPPKD